MISTWFPVLILPLHQKLIKKVAVIGCSRMIIIIWWIALVMLLTNTASSFISSQEYSRQISPSQNSDKPQGFKPAQNLNSDYEELNCTAATATSPRHYYTEQFLFLKENLPHKFEISWGASEIFSLMWDLGTKILHLLT